MDLEARAQLDPIRRIPGESARILSFLKGLQAEDWEKPTRCPRWSVFTVAAHLALNAEFLAESVRTALDKAGAPDPAEFPPDPLPLPFGLSDLSEFKNWGRENLKRLIEGGPDGLASAFEKAAAGLQERIVRIHAGNAGTPFWHPGGEGRLGYIPTLRLLELTYHDWDIRTMDDPDTPLSPTAIPILADRLPMMFGRSCRLRSKSDSPAGRTRILVTDPARNFLLDWKGKESRAVIDGGGNVDVTLTGKANTFLLLAAGRASREACEKERTFHMLGDVALGEALAAVLFQPLKYL